MLIPQLVCFMQVHPDFSRHHGTKLLLTLAMSSFVVRQWQTPSTIYCGASTTQWSLLPTPPQTQPSTLWTGTSLMYGCLVVSLYTMYSTLTVAPISVLQSTMWIVSQWLPFWQFMVSERVRLCITPHITVYCWYQCDIVPAVTPVVYNISNPLTAVISTNTSLFCVATGFPLPTIYWLKNGVNITYTELIRSTTVSTVDSTITSLLVSGNIPLLSELGRVGILSFSSVVRSDTANYTCVASNYRPLTGTRTSQSNPTTLTVEGIVHSLTQQY